MEGDDKTTTTMTAMNDTPEMGKVVTLKDGRNYKYMLN
jgi:hypothetical protein